MVNSPPNDESLTDQDWLQAVWKRADRDDILVAAQEEARRRERAARTREVEARATDTHLVYGFQPPPPGVVRALDMNAVEEDGFMPPMCDINTPAPAGFAPSNSTEVHFGFPKNQGVVNYQWAAGAPHPQMVSANNAAAPIISADGKVAVTRQRNDNTERMILAKRNAREAREGTSRADETPPGGPYPRYWLA